MFDAGYGLYCAVPADCESRRDALIMDQRRATAAAEAASEQASA
jgi:hypothetical protein